MALSRFALPFAAAAAATFLIGSREANAQEKKKHQLQRIGEDSVDLVMSVSWDFDAENQGGRPYVTNVLRAFADRTYDMTEGRLRICKVFIYNKGEQRSKNADIFFDFEGRSNTTEVGVLYESYGQINLFRKTGTAVRGETDLGYTLAHEFGHYGLFLKDEYTEPKDPGEGEQFYYGPRVCDATLITGMGKNTISDLSLPKDYDDENYAPWLPDAGADLTNKDTKYRNCELLVDQEHFPDGGPIKPPYAGPKENARGRTAQWRTYQMSAWDFLVNGPEAKRFGAAAGQERLIKRFPSITRAGNPALPLRNPRLTADTDCHLPIFMEGTFVVLLLDRSHSMDQKKAPGSDITLFDIAKKNAVRFVESAPPGTTIALMTFADDGRVALEPVHIGKDDIAQKRAEIIGAINNLKTDAVSGTNVDRGLVASFDMFLKNAAVGNQQYMVILSDGFTTASRSFEDPFVSTRIPVFTQRIGSDGTGNELIEIADRTRGTYEANTDRAWTDLTIKELLLNREPIGIRTFPKPVDKSPIESPTHITELDGPTTFHGRWPTGDIVAFQLRAPDNTLITPVSLPAGVTYELNDDGARFIVAQPTPGMWTPILLPAGIPTGDMRVHVSGNSAFTIKIEVDNYQSYPDPFFMRVTLAAPNPVLGAHIVGKLDPVLPPGALGEKPPGFQLDVRDDGIAPDLVANDGVYSAVFARVVADGDYAFTITADDANGAAHLFVGEDGPDGQPTKKPFPAFTRERSIIVTALGSRPMPQTKTDAIRLRNDLTPLWGTINQPGESVWYEMNGFANGHYAIMTGELLSNDDSGLPMKTSLTVYGPDGVTMLASSAEDDGRAFATLKTPSTPGQYFLKVSHPGNGVGRFRIAAAPKDWFDRKAAAFGSGDQDDDDGCDCRTTGGSRGNGENTSLGVLAAVFALGIARRIAKTKKESAMGRR